MAGNKSGAVVVTGASTGIGRACVNVLDEAGYRVFAGVRKQKDANAIKKESSKNVVPITIDVTKERSITTARQKVQRAVGNDGLVGLVNNAGVGGGGPIEFIPIDDFRNTLEVNLVGQVAVTQTFLPLIRQGRGTVVFIASIGGRIASPFMSPYNASKFGIEAVGDSLRREVKPWGIDVVVVEPGSIDTKIWEKGGEQLAERQAVIPREAKRLYGKQFESFGKVIQETASRGIPAEKVGEVVLKGIRKRRPKHRYLVGTDAKIGARANAVMPSRTFDRMVRRQTGMPKKLPTK
jgi:NAD(P)-dependent dehydrogenase (short-subunit alcohol dehydrogenase family)